MQKRRAAGVVMFMAIVTASVWVQNAAARTRTETVENVEATQATDADAAARALLARIEGLQWVQMVGSVSETTRLFGAGVALLGLAAGVRRHSS
jgi:hypothetical protein